MNTDETQIKYLKNKSVKSVFHSWLKFFMVIKFSAIDKPAKKAMTTGEEGDSFGKAKRPIKKQSAVLVKRRKNYFDSSFLSSFLGLHFSQVLPSFLAATQHLCVHSFPSALAFSQHVFLSSASEEPTVKANKQAITDNDLMSFIFFIFFSGFKMVSGCFLLDSFFS